MKKNIIYILITVVVFIGIIYFAKPNEDQNKKVDSSSIQVSSASSLTANTTRFNFGEISMKNGNVKHEFEVVNNTINPVLVSKVYTSCMCTRAFVTINGKTKGPFGMPGHGVVPKADMEILSQEQAIITIEFDPKAHGPAGVGRIEREIYIEDEDGSQVILSFEAIVTP